MDIGVPAKPYFLGIDTGSNLTWLECQHHGCKNCKGPHPPYYPKKSHNFVKRGDPLCCELLKDLPGHNNLPCTRKVSGECRYKIRYFDGKSSEGVVASDMVKTTLSKSLLKVQDALLPVCWKGSKPIKSIKEVEGKFKPLSLEFDNKAVMHIPPKNYLVHTAHGNVCLGILNGSKFLEGQMMRIGDVSMQDLLVIYDKVERRIGWVSKSCPTPEIPSTHVL